MSEVTPLCRGVTSDILASDSLNNISPNEGGRQCGRIQVGRLYAVLWLVSGQALPDLDNSVDSAHGSEPLLFRWVMCL